MVVLGRHVGDIVHVYAGGHRIEVVICGIDRNRVQLGVHAPRDVRIMRKEAERPIMDRLREPIPTAWGTF